MRRLLALSSIVVVVAAIASLAAWQSTLAQEDAGDCPPTDMGELNETNSPLSASGDWSGAECNDSRFHDGRPGRQFIFSVSAVAVVRVDLNSDDRDPILYLQDAEGALIDSDDDTGGSNDARIERELPAGVYTIEASAVGWAGRDFGTFDLSVRIVSGCHDVVDLGTLEDSLSSEGVWSHYGCESAFRSDRSSQRYRFELSELTRVQIDLISVTADSYLYLLDADGALLEVDDDGGDKWNSRIVRLLDAGTFTLETTNWGDRDLKNLQEAGYRLSITRAVDGPTIKLDAILAPERVVQGLPFDIHYRVSNLGDAPVSSVDGRVQVRVRWPYISNWRTSEIDTSGDDGELWGVGASYHSDESLAAFGSQPLEQLFSFSGLFTWRHGPSDVMLDVSVLDPDDKRLSRHVLSRPIMVLTGFDLGALTVSVDGAEYRVVSTVGEDGEVETEVTAVSAGLQADESNSADEDASKLPDDVQLKALYAAGVQTQVLSDLPAVVDTLRTAVDSFFAQVSRGGLPLSDVPSPSAPTRDALLAVSASAHRELLEQAGFDSSRFQSAETAEALVVRAGQAAALRIERSIDRWSLLADVISAQDAIAAHASLSLAAQVDARLVEAAELVLLKRGADNGWDDAAVASALADFRGGIDCRPNTRALSSGDAVLRHLSPVYAAMLDRAYCGILAADDDHDQLLTGLGLSMNPLIPETAVEDRPRPTPQVPSVEWVLTRVHEDGRIEFATELSNGEQVLPSGRMFPADAPTDVWLRTGPVMFGETELGRIYARRLGTGTVEAAFVASGGRPAGAARWSLPADTAVGVWLLSGPVERAAVGSGDDLVQRVADQPAGAGAAQFGDHLSLLSFIENNLQRNP
ncbi:MAG: hypothetical protein F4066_04415 [Chloroflexi bacterium]|nr:hypothetical protein [Chloroflexota bacterium]MYF81873.1 hypothetical protein [Chloroflexota bacterium]MYI04087.1 hypothetical protein [Chloroflexota bacterium]